MKDYEVTKIWATEIAEISQMISDGIEYKRARIKTLEFENDGKNRWWQDKIEELEQQIAADEWILNRINTPFKFER